MDMMETEYLICKICKKTFQDVNGLRRHQMNQHPNANKMTDKQITSQFGNNNISITRIISPKTINQSPFLKTPGSGVAQSSINIRRAEARMLKKEGKSTIPFRNSRIRSAAISLVAMEEKATGVRDVTTDLRKWEPMAKGREVANTDVSTIITASVAQRATTACRDTPEQYSQRQGNKSLKLPPQAKKSAPPQMIRVNSSMSEIAPKNGKRPVPGLTASPIPRSSVGVRTAPAVHGIMQNLGKMKSMNQAAAGRPTPKMISVPARVAPQAVAKKPVPVPKPAQTPPFRVNKPPQVSKNKAMIVPRNAYNNALPLPGNQSQPPQLQAEDGMEFDDEYDEDEDDEEDYSVMDLPQLANQASRSNNHLPAKKSAATSNPPPKSFTGNTTTAKGNAGGKIPPTKTLNSNRFNPVDAKNKPTAVARNGNSGKPNVAKAKGQTNGNPVVVAKKSEPKKADLVDVVFKKMKKCIPTMLGTKYEMPKMSAKGSYTRDGVQVWVCLVCNEKEEEQSSRDMICCDACEDWYHTICVGIIGSFPEEEPWFCKRCIFQHSANPVKEFPNLFKSNAARH